MSVAVQEYILKVDHVVNALVAALAPNPTPKFVAAARGKTRDISYGLLNRSLIGCVRFRRHARKKKKTIHKDQLNYPKVKIITQQYRPQNLEAASLIKVLQTAC